MNWYSPNMDTHIEARRLEREHRDTDLTCRYRELWFRTREESRSARSRALAGWLGDVLVAAGERLRAWAAGQGQLRIAD